jgi:ribonuclease-3
MSVSSPISFEPLMDLLGYHFSNIHLLRQALIPSGSQQKENNERLEFLGDRVLGLSIAHRLYQTFPAEKEGQLAKRFAGLVQKDTLKKIAISLNLSDYIQGTPPYEDSVLADTVEAILGAAYLDGDAQKVDQIIRKLWQNQIDDSAAPPIEPKSALQEWTQSLGLGIPEYQVIDQSGLDHAPVFIVEIHVKGYKHFQASASSKKAAEKEAASAFLEFYKAQGVIK